MNKAKIDELFEYRRVPELLSEVSKDTRKGLKKKLMKLQASIYNLDHYLESNWKLDVSKLEQLWERIFAQMEDLNIPQKDVSRLLSSIRRYQLHESQLRENKLPTRLDPEYYYYYKSCDVRLIRNIIYKNAPELSKRQNVTDWRYYDLITEINDDIDDFFEDLDNINGNMFLIKAFQDGVNEAADFFDEFLDQILIKSINRSGRKSNEDLKLIKKWTFNRYVETKQLLEKRRKSILKKGINPKKAMIKRLRKLEKKSNKSS